jgi:uncharacterized protein YjbI with pentapeptide repeats
MSGAKLCEADLTGADLSRAILAGADLSNAKLQGAKITEAKYDEATQWPDGYTPDIYDGLLLKCEESPHVYRIERGKRRWIKDLDTFKAEGHIWHTDVRTVSRDCLRSLPDGEPVPPDAGPSPQP